MTQGRPLGWVTACQFMCQFASRMSLLAVLGYASLLRSTLEHCWLLVRRAGSVTVGVQPVSAPQALASTLDL